MTAVTRLEAAEVFTGSFKDYKVDSDADGKADELDIDVELNVPVDGNQYLIRGFLISETDLKSKEGHPYQVYNKYNLDLKKGVNIVTLHFDGYKIFKDKMNGPYILSNLYFGRYLKSAPKDVYEDLGQREAIKITTLYKYTEFEQPNFSFRGKQGSFDLELGQGVNIIEGEIGTIQIKLLSLSANSAEVLITTEDYEAEQKLAIEEGVSFVTGGLEQTGTLKLLGAQDKTAKFHIEFGSASPAPKISDDMRVDIFHLK